MKKIAFGLGGLTLIAVGVLIGTVIPQKNNEKLPENAQIYTISCENCTEIGVKIDVLSQKIDALNAAVLNIGIDENEDYEEEVPAPVEEEAVEVLSLSRLPEGNTNTYRCMDYRTITSVGSVQYLIQQYAYTDVDTGIRCIENGGDWYYTVALAGAYGTDLGNCWKVTLENGTTFNIMQGDFKHPIDSVNPNDFGDKDTNYDGEPTTSVIEFIVDSEYVPSSVMNAGTMSALRDFGGLNGTGGNIASMEYLGYIDPSTLDITAKG